MIRLLVPLDGSKLAEQALVHAISFAKSFEAELHLLQVIESDIQDPDKPFDGLDWELRCTQCKCYLNRLQDLLAEQRIDATSHVVEGKPSAEIVEFCKRHKIDLMLLSAYGVGGVTQFPKGSTVQKVISKADLSLLLVRPDETAAVEKSIRYRRLLVLLDGSRRSDWALHLAATIARANAAELSLLQIIQQPKVTPGVLDSAEGQQLIERIVELNKLDALRHMEEVKSRLPKGLTVKSRVLVAPETPAAVEEIAQADDVDLIVLSAHGMTDSSYWLYGPVAESILAHASRPVLVFQDALERNIVLKPISGSPARSNKVERQQDRAKVS